MPPLWKPQNGFHSGLEISHRTRDSHISTADHRHDRIEERRTGQSRRNQARSARRQTRGTLGGKVLKTRGPLLLKTDMVQTPFQAPNANAHAERFVRSIKSECLDRLILLGERHLRQTDHSRIHGALPSRAESSRSQERADRDFADGGDQQLPDSPSTASRRAPQLLRARGVIR